MSRDLRGFEELCRREYSGLVRTGYLMTHDREEALDLAQEALARAFARWGTVSHLDRPDLWLHRVVPEPGQLLASEAPTIYSAHCRVRD